jgi:uncharacterized protein YbaP (TraB family)
MKIFRFGFLIPLLAVACTSAQKIEQQPLPEPENSLLWEISGKNLSKPSYLFGTIHMLCKEDAALGDSLLTAIAKTERVYLELDMDNIFEMLGALRQMKMKNDTTLADLLSKEDYNKVKEYMTAKSSLLPFSELETYKPLLASSLLLESAMDCGTPVAMEQLIMEEAKKRGKRIEGLESMAYQMSIFDSIPYKTQAEQLLKFVSDTGNQSDADNEFGEMMNAYKNQDLKKLSELINRSEAGIVQFEDLLLYNRNRNWVQKLKTIMPERPVTIAVGAGHLPGVKGVINLLRKEGYTVKPVKNKISNQKVI